MNNSKTSKIIHEGGLQRALGEEHAIVKTCNLKNRKCLLTTCFVLATVLHTSHINSFDSHNDSIKNTKNG